MQPFEILPSCLQLESCFYFWRARSYAMTLLNGKCNHVCVMYNKLSICLEPDEPHHQDFGRNQIWGIVTIPGTSPASNFAFLTCIRWRFVTVPQRMVLRQHSKKTVSQGCMKLKYSVCPYSRSGFGLFNGKGHSQLGKRTPSL